MVPEGWSSRPLGVLLDFKNGVNTDAANYGAGTKFVNVMDVFGGTSLTQERILGSVTVTDRQRAEYALRHGDILFNRTSETREEIAYASVYLDDRPAVFGGFVIRGRPRDTRLHPEFSQYCFMQPAVRREFVRRCQGAIRANIGQQDMSEVELLLPPLAEQRRIAAILGAWDRAVETAEALVVNSQKQKRAVMRLLLSGERRLRSYDSLPWDSVALRAVVSQFIVPMRDKPQSFEGSIPWCRIEDFEGIYLDDSKSAQYVSEQIVEAMNLKVFPVGTVVVSCSANLGVCAIVARPLVTNQTFIGLVPSPDKVDPLYLYYAMTENAHRLNALSSGTTISYLSREEFEKFELRMPSTVKEQSAIATAINNIDQHIEGLRKNVECLRLQKAALMQELLTGKRRVRVKGAA